MTTASPTTRPRARADANPALRVETVSVQFGAFKALTDVTLETWPGEVVGIIGPNGAGKSTLVNALAGVVTPQSGTITLAGRPLGQLSTWRRAHLGLVRTFQTAQLFGSLSVRVNIALARRRGAAESAGPLVDDATRVLRLDGVRDSTTDKLSGGQRKLVEFTRALAAAPDVLLLDEPVAGVPMRDRATVLNLMRRHVDETGSSVLLVEHDMEFVSSVCDWIYVMNAGAIIATGTWDEISTNPLVLEAYLGSSTTAPTESGD